MRAVDYVQALLVAEPIEILQQIIEELVHTTEQEKFTTYLTATSTFLKYRYNNHVVESGDECVSHGLPYILGRNSKKNYDLNTENKKGMTCCQCKFPFFVCHELRQKVMQSERSVSTEDATSMASKQHDAINVIDECERKFKLFLGHHARCVNQNKALSDIEERLKSQCLDESFFGCTAIMIADFKMKFEPMSSRETTLDHYGKRGISWHGFCLVFFLKQEVRNTDGSLQQEAVKYSVYLNQLMAESNK